MSPIREVLKSQSFIEKSSLLILTAIITGILVPYINAKLSDKKFKEQRLFDAAMARQAKIIDAQNELLSDLETIVNSFQLRALAVAWYITSNKNFTLHKASKKEYEDKAWEFFGKMQNLIGKASRLTSPGVHKELQKFYEEMKQLDVDLVRLMQNETTEEEWQKFYNTIQSESGVKLRAIVEQLAQDYGLSRKNDLESRN